MIMADVRSEYSGISIVRVCAKIFLLSHLPAAPRMHHRFCCNSDANAIETCILLDVSFFGHPALSRHSVLEESFPVLPRIVTKEA